MTKRQQEIDEVISTPSALYETKTKTILFATDFSLTCGKALNWATALAASLDARLLILHVEQPGVPFGGGEVYSSYVFDYHSQTLLKMLEQVKPTNQHVPFSHHLVSGDPATEIVRVAKEETVDMIIMSTHGRSGLTRVLIGSVAEDVVRHANCPVLIFKSPLTILSYHNQRGNSHNEAEPEGG